MEKDDPKLKSMRNDLMYVDITINGKKVGCRATHVVTKGEAKRLELRDVGKRRNRMFSCQMNTMIMEQRAKLQSNYHG